MNIYQKDHPHNAVFVAQLQSVIDGAPRVVQIQMNAGPEKHYWKDIVNDTSGTPQTEFIDILAYRLKPTKVTRTLTYPEPLRIAPKVGTMVWMPNAFYDPGLIVVMWIGNMLHQLALKRGFIFETESDAAEAAREIFGGEL